MRSYGIVDAALMVLTDVESRGKDIERGFGTGAVVLRLEIGDYVDGGLMTSRSLERGSRGDDAGLDGRSRVVTR